MTLRRIAPPVVALFIAGSAQAATISYESNEVAADFTDWTDTLTLTKFSTSLGTLNSIKIELIGNLEGEYGIENLDAKAASFTATLSAVLTLTRPDTSTLVVTTPLASRGHDFPQFDGAEDFSGDSGDTVTVDPFSASNSVTFDGAADLTLFTGIGSIALPLSAVGTSDTSGNSANVSDFYDTLAGGKAIVTYNYAPIPEPGAWAMLLAGLGVVGLLARRRRD